MKHKYKNLVGVRFGRLTVESWACLKNKQTYWSCVCDCGNKTIVSRSSLINGDTKSCGCYNADKQKTHNMTRTRIYNIWSLMKARCNRKSCPAYKNYGERGIKVCKEWNDFVVFYKWAKENGYKQNLTIDRKDVNGNYCPENCRWITMKEQKLNKRGTLYYFDETLKNACKRLGLSYKLVWKYKKENRTIEESVLKALETKIKKLSSRISRLRDDEPESEEISILMSQRSAKREEIKQRYPYAEDTEIVEA